MAKLGKQIKDFEVEALMPSGDIERLKITDYRGKYVVIFFYPLDFTFVCPTEIISLFSLKKEFNNLDTQVLLCSIDSAYSHKIWTQMKLEERGIGKNVYPMLADIKKEVAEIFDALGDDGIAFRTTAIIDPDGKLVHISSNIADVGRSPHEILRLLNAFRHVEVTGDVCPVSWVPGMKSFAPNEKSAKEYFEQNEL